MDVTLSLSTSHEGAATIGVEQVAVQQKQQLLQEGHRSHVAILQCITDQNRLTADFSMATPATQATRCCLPQISRAETWSCESLLWNRSRLKTSTSTANVKVLEAVLWELSLAQRLLATFPLHTLVAGHSRSCSPSVQTSCLGRSKILGCVTINTTKSNGSGMCPNVHGVKGVKQATASSHILSFFLIG